MTKHGHRENGARCTRRVLRLPPNSHGSDEAEADHFHSGMTGAEGIFT